MKLIVFLGLPFFALTACTGSNTDKDFLCEAQIGTPCSTIEQADQQVSGGKVTSVAEKQEDTLGSLISQAPLAVGKSGSIGANMPDGGAAYNSARYRVPEKTSRLWIGPYLDDEGILHESRFVHFVLSEAAWVGEKP
jgi:conjugal transfer pilus assembly protein TraV